MTKILPRPVSALQSLFGANLDTLPKMEAEQTTPSAKIYFALKTPNGDAIFRNATQWYVLPAGKNTAYQIKSLGETSTSSDEGYSRMGSTFGNDIKPEENAARLEYADGKGVLTSGFNEIALSPLDDAELSNLQKRMTRGDLTCVSLPAVRTIERAAHDPATGDYFVLGVDSANYSYEAFRLFKGPLNDLKELSVVHVDRFRDGGTTIIDTEEGRLFFPTPVRPERVPSWCYNENGKEQTVELAKVDAQEISVKIGNSMPALQGIKPYTLEA